MQGVTHFCPLFGGRGVICTFLSLGIDRGEAMEENMPHSHTTTLKNQLTSWSQTNSGIPFAGRLAFNRNP